MSKISKIVALLLIFHFSNVYPVESNLSRWFSASYVDLGTTLKRLSYCINHLTPLTSKNLNETEFLIHQIGLFFDEARYNNEQLLNVTQLMDEICRQEPDAEYPISAFINVNMYNHSIIGKENRCHGIDQALDSMYFVFKKAALNNSEPLDFSVIRYFPGPVVNQTESYNLTDLINTIWIKSEAPIENVCAITNSVKRYVLAHTSNSTDIKREGKSSSVFESFFDMIDRVFLEPLLGFQKRLYWEGNNRLEVIYAVLSNQMGNLRNEVGSVVKGTRGYLSSMFSSTPSKKSNLTSTTTNSTKDFPATIKLNNSTKYEDNP